jgi:NAD+ diphosphatase
MWQRQAAIAVLVRQRRLLVIERSRHVRAPGKFCFPGGEVEAGEHIAEAVVRELREELGLQVRPLRPLWTSTASSGCILHWIHTTVATDSQPVPDQHEVASWHWMTRHELFRHPRVLPSNREFLQAWEAGAFELPGS